MMTEKQFRDDPKIRAEYAGLLEHPLLRNAISIVEEKAKPRGLPNPQMGTHMDTMASQKLSRIAGIQQAIDNLKALCDPWPVSTDEAKPDEMNDVPYFHTFPKQMQDALRQLRVEGKF